MQPATNTEQHYRFTHPERERACPLFNSFIMWGVRHYEVEKKWKRGKKLKKGKERKSEGVVGRGNRLPEGIMGFGKQEACMYACFGSSCWVMLQMYASFFQGPS